MGSTPSKPTVPAVDQLDEKRSVMSGTASSKSIGSQVTARAPVSADGSLALASIADWEDAASSDPKTKLARTILAHSDIRSALINRDAKILDQHVFNTELEFKTSPVTNQRSSGRCWLFATTNVLRYQVMKKLNLKEFELSQVGDFSADFIYDKFWIYSKTDMLMCAAVRPTSFSGTN